MRPRIDNPPKEPVSTIPINRSPSYDRYPEALERPGRAIRPRSLAAAKISFAHVEFDGQGDSGTTTDVVADRRQEQVDPPAAAVMIRQASRGTAEMQPRQKNLAAAIETLCYDHVGTPIEAWKK